MAVLPAGRRRLDLRHHRRRRRRPGAPPSVGNRVSLVLVCNE
jgi:hypothetical protein